MVTVHHLKAEPSRKRRVLVVEDNLDSVHSMAMLVKMMGHEVRFAINGCEIARQLRFEDALGKTRFVAISALPAQQYRNQALAAGCDEFYPKPIDPAVLEKLLDDSGAAERHA
jgi:CheY-like chemotaxis protein